MTTSKITISAVIIGSVFTAGCATTEGNVALAGLGCSAISAGVGIATGSLGAGLGTAAVCGTLAAIAISQYDPPQARTATQEQKAMGFKRAPDSPILKINQTSATPAQIKPGQNVDILVDYSLALPASISTSEVSLSTVMKKDGKILQESNAQKVQKSGGGYSGKAAVIPMPSNAEPGTYVVEVNMQSGTSYGTSQAVFVVSR